jgi:hypothetical protein
MTKLIGVMLLAGSSLFAAPHFSIGIGVGAPAYYPPPVAVSPAPAPGYTWVDGYWAPDGTWVAGYWAPPEYYAVPAYPVYRRDFDRHDFDRGRDHDRRVDRGHERDEHHNGFRR